MTNEHIFIAYHLLEVVFVIFDEMSVQSYAYFILGYLFTFYWMWDFFTFLGTSLQSEKWFANRELAFQRTQRWIRARPCYKEFTVQRSGQDNKK